MANHTIEKIDKNRGIRRIEAETLDAKRTYWSNKISDRSLGCRISGILNNSDLSNVVIDERINNIINLFKSYGYTDEDAKEFICKNPIVIERTVDSINESLIILASIVANNKNKDLIEFISSDVNNGSILLVSPENLSGVYNLVFDMFAANCSCNQEAYEYLYNNKNLLHMSYDSIVAKLSIYNLVNLDEEVFFNNPSMLDHKILYSEIYNAVAICHNNNNVSLENVISVINSNNEKIKSIHDIKSTLIYSIDKDTLNKLKSDYIAELTYNAERTQMNYTRRVM